MDTMHHKTILDVVCYPHNVLLPHVQLQHPWARSPEPARPALQDALLLVVAELATLSRVQLVCPGQGRRMVALSCAV